MHDYGAKRTSDYIDHHDEAHRHRRRRDHLASMRRRTASETADSPTSRDPPRPTAETVRDAERRESAARRFPPGERAAHRAAGISYQSLRVGTRRSTKHDPR